MAKVVMEQVEIYLLPLYAVNMPMVDEAVLAEVTAEVDLIIQPIFQEPDAAIMVAGVVIQIKA